MFFSKKSVGKIFLGLQLASISTFTNAATPPLIGRFQPEATVLCSDGSAPDFQNYNAIVDYQLIPMSEANPQSAPVIWLSERLGTPVIAVPAFVRIDHWTCPPNGNSRLVHREFYYHSLYSHDGNFSGEYKLIGSHPSGDFTSSMLYLGRDLTEDISDEITFHMDERIDGAIEKFSYHGPQKSLAMSITPNSAAQTFTAVFKNVCSQGSENLVLNYVLSPELQ
jgi:hypothetical protein